VINVALGAGVTAGLSYVVQHLSGGSIDVSGLAQVVGTAVCTALVRALNPADTSYGVGSDVPPVPVGVPDVTA
jgi:hypothetical protein